MYVCISINTYVCICIYIYTYTHLHVQANEHTNKHFTNTHFSLAKGRELDHTQQFNHHN